MLVALGVVAVHAGGLDEHLDLGGGGVLLVVAEAAGEVVEAPVEPAIAQVLDAELDEGVGAFGVLLRSTLPCYCHTPPQRTGMEGKDT